MLRPSVKIFLGILITLGLVVLAVWIGLKPTASVAPVTRGTAVFAIPGSVSVSTRAEVTVRSRLSAPIEALRVKEGDLVQQGDELALLDSREWLLERDRLEGELSAARRRLEIGAQSRFRVADAREDLENLERMFGLGTVSEDQVARQRRVLRQLEEAAALEEIALQQEVDRLESQKEILEFHIEQTVILAPIDGLVQEVLMTEGDLARDGSALVSLLSNDRIVRAEVGEEDFSSIEEGLPVKVRFLTYGNRLFEGSVAKIIPSADEVTRRYTLHLDMQMDNELLTPGLTGEVSIIADSRDNTLLLPSRALIGNQVFKVQDGRVVLTGIETGFRGLQQVEVVSGLQEGDLVVVDGLDRFRDGDRVRVKASVSP